MEDRVLRLLRMGVEDEDEDVGRIRRSIGEVRRDNENSKPKEDILEHDGRGLHVECSDVIRAVSLYVYVYMDPRKCVPDRAHKSNFSRKFLGFKGLKAKDYVCR